MSDASPAAVELLRDAARLILDQPAEIIGQLDRDVLGAAPREVRSEPVLAAEVAASTRANIVHWATCVAADPTARVPVNLSREVLQIARDAVRLGSEHMIRSTYHAGQNVAWRYTLEVAFGMSSDAAVLHDALTLAARSIFTFVDDTITALEEQIERERRELTEGTHAERFEVVTLIVEGSAISSERASERLRYELRRRHTAAVLWSDPGVADHGELTRAAEALARAAGATRPLTVVASAAALWVWFVAADEVDFDVLRRALEPIAGVRAALGSPQDGIEGFRRSHLDAVAAQRLMFQAPAGPRIASFDDVRLVTLAAQDGERAAEFVARALGDLATADAELRDTVRVYIREEFSASRAARALFAHRNTVLNRLARAERLMPAPLAGRGLEVGLALEIVHWLGARVAGEGA